MVEDYKIFFQNLRQLEIPKRLLYRVNKVPNVSTFDRKQNILPFNNFAAINAKNTDCYKYISKINSSYTKDLVHPPCATSSLKSWGFQ